MNKNHYRVIFNKVRGVMMVVAEHVSSGFSTSKGESGDMGQPVTSMVVTILLLRLAVLLITGSATLMPMSASAAGILADKTAPIAQQPNVTQAANGVPLVNIQTPSAAGVSRNTYSQFDVNQQGAILNNSRVNAQTRLGGWVQGNQNLAGGTARVILNEVNSSNPSLLNGYVEIAGSRAQLVIANPAGISCDGCGFINANRATLTTGTPIMNSGNLVGYRVGGGSINFSGSGLDARQANYTDVIARAVQVNAGIWAGQLNVITGTNQVNIDNSGNPTIITPITPDTGSSTPGYAIDVAALGGMYAGKIRLIGTEAGLGVRNAGGIGANAGEVALTIDGQLINKGTIATGDISMRIGNLNNSNGNIVANDSFNATISDIDNTSGHISGSDLSINSDAIINTGGTWLAEQSLAITSTSLSGDGQLLSQGDMNLSLVDAFINNSEIIANGNFTFSTVGKLTNHSKLLAGNDLDILAQDMDNSSGAELRGSNTFVTVDHTLINRGLIDSVGDTFITVANIDNIGTGQIYGDHIAIESTTLGNTNEASGGITSAASIAARERLDIGSSDISNQADGLIFSGGDLAIGGSLDANHSATGSATSITNSGASIESLGGLSIAANSLINKRETFSMNRPLISASTARWQQCVPGNCSYVDHITQQTYMYEDGITSISPKAIISAGGNASFAVNEIRNKYSTIQAGGNLDLVGSNLLNIGAELYRVTNVITTTNRIHWGDRDHGTWVTSSSSSRLIDTVPATITAGSMLTGSFTGRINNTTIREHTVPLADTQGTIPAALTTASINVSNSSLFRAVPDPVASYLVETDPRFANYRNWLSSDFMLQQLSFDPDITQKRLGDGFYEQRLVREQIAELTGRRFLGGYANDEVQYQALMSNALTQMDALTLIPGIALSPVQIAQLTSDIVWLVEQEVTLPDGTVTKALVPHVYVRLQDGDLSTSGALLAGNDIHLEVTGDPANGAGAFTTTGTIAGHNIVTINAANINNVRGLVEGRDVSMNAAQDINIEGGSVVGEDRVVATAGNDINVRSSTTNMRVSMDGTPIYVNSHVIDRVAGLYVSNPDAILVASAGNDVNLMAAVIQNSGANTNNAGGTLIGAGNDINIGVVAEKTNSYSQGRNSWRRENASADIGSVIQASGDVTMIAGNNFKATAASVSSEEGALQVSAAKDITITAGTNTFESDAYRKIKKSGSFGSSKKERWDSIDQTTRSASTFSADTVTLQAGDSGQQGNISVEGSNVVSTNGTALEATGNVALKSVANILDETHISKKKRSGFGTSGASISYGSSKLKTNQTIHAVTQSGSTVGSTNGNVVITAGKAYMQKGSDVLAPNGDIDISAQKVDIAAAQNVSNQSTETKFKQSGITLSISNPVVSAIQTVDQMRQSASETSDSRMQALAAATAALSVKNAYDMINLPDQYGNVPTAGNTGSDDLANVRTANLADRVGGINVSVSVGSSKSSSKITQTSTYVQGGQVLAGGDINITAQGASQDSDVNVIGSQIKAGENVSIIATDQVNLIAAKNTETLNSKNKGSSASLGASFGTNGLVVSARASKGKGKANGTDITWTETIVEAGNKISMESGTDTSLIGAQVKSQQIVADVGTSGIGNLNVQSLQDISAYNSKQKSAGLSVSVPIGAGSYGGSISSSNTKIESDYASVNEQAGIFAGDEGFQVSVASNTNLTGAVIASSKQAIQDGKNSLTSETLTTTDIQNKAEYEADSSSSNLSLSYDSSKTMVKNLGNNLVNLPSSLVPELKQNGSDSSLTRSAISASQITITDDEKQRKLTGKDAATTIALLNRDVDNANPRMLTRPEIESIKQDQAANSAIVSAAVVQVTQAVNTYYIKRIAEYDRQYNETINQAREKEAQASILEAVGDGESAATLKQEAQLLRSQAIDLRNERDNPALSQGLAQALGTALIGGLAGQVDAGQIATSYSLGTLGNTFLLTAQKRDSDITQGLVVTCNSTPATCTEAAAGLGDQINNAETPLEERIRLLQNLQVKKDKNSNEMLQAFTIILVDKNSGANPNSAINGILNEPDRAGVLAIGHLRDGETTGQSIYLSYNDTQGGLADLLNAFIDKNFAVASNPSMAAAQAIIDAGEQAHTYVYAHSGGTLISNIALNSLSSLGYANQNLHVDYFGPASTMSNAAAAALNAAGLSNAPIEQQQNWLRTGNIAGYIPEGANADIVYGSGYFNNPNDPVATFIGFNFGQNNAYNDQMSLSYLNGSRAGSVIQSMLETYDLLTTNNSAHSTYRWNDPRTWPTQNVVPATSPNIN